MIESSTIEHHIQKSIVTFLMAHQFARFRDMRPPKVDTNLYSYHLKLLQKNGFVEKTEAGYTLSKKGQIYVDRVNIKTVRLSTQPKIITMLVIQNGYGGILMYKKLRQPFIDQWTLPLGKVHNDDTSIQEAAKREVREKIGGYELTLEHVGDCYIRVHDDEELQISTLVHVFYGQTDDDLANDHMAWISPHTLPGLDVSPAVDQIVARTFFRDPYFFEEFDVAW